MAAKPEAVAQTVGGKEIRIVPMHNRSLMMIEFGSGGQVPDELSGAFANRTDAMKAVDAYIAKNIAKNAPKRGRSSKS